MRRRLPGLPDSRRRNRLSTSPPVQGKPNEETRSMRGADRLLQLSVKDDGFLFDPSTGDTYVANPTALLIVRGLQAGRDEGQVVDELVAEYDVTEVEARRDAADLLGRLKSWQLI
jgi:PqqD family protein of HPr-rel-A system